MPVKQTFLSDEYLFLSLEWSVFLLFVLFLALQINQAYAACVKIQLYQKPWEQNTRARLKESDRTPWCPVLVIMAPDDLEEKEVLNWDINDMKLPQVCYLL